MKTIKYGNEYMNLHDDGCITTSNWNQPSGQWRVVGAVQFNNFGNIVRSFNLEDVLKDRIPTYKYKNGKQKVFIKDFDHGMYRIWGSPQHEVYKGVQHES